MQHPLYALALTALLAPFSFASGMHDHQHAEPMAHHHNHAQTSMVGKPAPASKVTKTVFVSSLDSMQYVFDKPVEIKQGDVIRFVVTNKGAVDHEFSIGNDKEHAMHREMMKQMPNMVHQDGTTISLKPKETKEIIWQFTQKGAVVFACNIPSHYEAGMHNTIVVK